MREQLPTIEQAQALVAVLEFGGYSAAAKELGISRPAVVRRVQRLRDVIGRGSLVERGGRNPTATGELVLLQAERVIAAATGMVRAGKEVRISSYPTIAAHVLTSCPALFDADPPPAALYDIREGSRRAGGASLIDRLTDGDVDIVIAPFRFGRLGLEDVHLYPWTLQAFLAPDHPLREIARVRGGLRVADLEGLRVVAAPRDHGSRELLEELYVAEGRRLEVHFESPNQHLLRQFALSSRRYGAVIPSDAFWPEPPDSEAGVDLLNVAEELVTGHYHVFTRVVPRDRRDERTEAIGRVVSAIVAALERP